MWNRTNVPTHTHTHTLSEAIDFEKLRLILGDEVGEGQERYAFTWPGKADAIRQAQTPTTATLRPDEESSVDWDTTENLYIEGDNLEVLKLLQRGYHGKVKMIYIDPPYNTGNDFVYKDSFQDSIENYKEQAGLSGQSNADTSGRYHSDWLSMMYPRLRLARELLSNDGVIALSIDDDEVDNLKKLCDEIFGENNFTARFMWTKTMTPPALAYKSRKTVEYVLVYEKQRTTQKYFGDWLDNGDAPLLNSGNPKKRLRFPAGSVRFTFIDNKVLKEGKYERAELCQDVQIENGINSEPFDMIAEYKWSQPTLDEEVSNGTYFLIKSEKLAIRFQRPSSNDSYKTPTNYLPIKLDTTIDVDTNETATSELDRFGLGNCFPFPKPTSLVRTLLKMRCNFDREALVLDFFSGSATTADALMQMNAADSGNRRFLLVQLPEKQAGKYRTLCQLGEERIRRAGQKIKAEIEEESKQLKLGEEPKSVPDIGFRVLKLDSSNFDIVEGGALIDNLIKPGRTNDDIIFEMMLKWGLDLSLPIEKTEVAGYPITSIAADELICCMDEGLSIEVLEAIAALDPRRVFFLDSVLTDTIKLNAVQIFRRAGEKLGHEIELRTA